MPRHLPIAKREPPRSARRSFWGAKYLGFRCTGCGACCVDTIVPITGDDLARLVMGTGREAHRFVSFYTREDFSDDDTSDLEFAELDVGPRVMGLKRTHHRSLATLACVFFDGRCSVYEHRPTTCRLWPLRPSMRHGRLTRLELDQAVPCPYELDGQVDPKVLVREQTDSFGEDARWEKIVRAWNRRYAGGSSTAFLDYVLEELAPGRRPAGGISG